MGHLVGFDHISATVLDTSGAAGQLKPLPYSVKFVEPELPILPEKERYMRAPCDRHALALLTPEEGNAVELIHHHDDPGIKQAPYLAVADSPFAGGAPNLDEDRTSAALSEAMGRRFVRAELACGLPCYAPAEGDASPRGITTVVLPAADLAESTRFWTKGMGFREINQGDGWRLLEFKAIFKTLGQRLLLTQYPGKACGIRYIDDPGWTSLAFLAKNVHKSTSHLKDAGARDIGAPFSFTVNDVVLTLLFLRGPGNELIELMEVQKKQS